MASSAFTDGSWIIIDVPRDRVLHSIHHDRDAKLQNGTQPDDAALASIQHHRPIEKKILCRKYLRYLQQTKTVGFTIISVIKRIKFHISNAIITKVSLFDYAIYSSTGLHCKQYRPVEE